MKAIAKGKRASKRDLFAELSEGMTALAEASQGKRTLRTYAVEFRPAPEITARDLVPGSKNSHLPEVSTQRIGLERCARLRKQLDCEYVRQSDRNDAITWDDLRARIQRRR
jgi:hypothetical protein